MKTVFTNGCFDLLHAGHLQLLQLARTKGDRLIVAINSDESVRRLKTGRPVFKELDRRHMLLALRCVDEVWTFSEDTALQALQRAYAAHGPHLVYARGIGDCPAGSPESQFCAANGIELTLVAKLPGYSTSAVVETVRGTTPRSSEAADLAAAIVATHRRGGTVYLCGNGGSAAEASHFAAELVGRFRLEREPLRAVNLAADGATLTAIANDYGFDDVFARQLSAASDKDLLIALSTSGTSPNVLRALGAFPSGGRWLLTGTRTHGDIAGVRTVRAGSTETAAIQEGHLAFIHAVCAELDFILTAR